MQVSRETKNFFSFLSGFLKSSLDFEHFETKDVLIADVFPKLRSPKGKVRSMPKRCRFKGFFGK